MPPHPAAVRPARVTAAGADNEDVDVVDGPPPAVATVLGASPARPREARAGGGLVGALAAMAVEELAWAGWSITLATTAVTNTGTRTGRKTTFGRRYVKLTSRDRCRPAPFTERSVRRGGAGVLPPRLP